MTSARPKATPRLPPRWFIRLFWVMHRRIYGVSGGRVGLRLGTADRAGTLRLRTTGRRTGEVRQAMLAYILDGPNFVTLAMNGWGGPEPAWWLNLLAQPDARVDLADGPRDVRASAATGEERERLWAKIDAATGDLDRWATLRPRETAVVVLEPRSPAGS